MNTAKKNNNRGHKSKWVTVIITLILINIIFIILTTLSIVVEKNNSPSASIWPSNSNMPTVADLAYTIPIDHVYNRHSQGIGEVSPKPGVEGLGNITVKYNGASSNPTLAGSYNVTVDIKGGANYSAVTGLYLGEYVIAKARPLSSDLAYNIPKAYPYDGKAHDIGDVIPGPGISGLGDITAVKYNNSETIPVEVGEYFVTVDIAAGANYAEKTGLFLGSYIIGEASAQQVAEQQEAEPPPVIPPPTTQQQVNPPPTTQQQVNPPPATQQQVTPPPATQQQVTPPPATQQQVTPQPTPQPTEQPAALKTPTAGDLAYSIPNIHVYTGSPQGIGSVSAKAGVSGLGSIKVKYNGANVKPTNAGNYAVTVEIAAGTSYLAAAEISLGSYTIAKATPKASDLAYSIPANHISNGGPQGIGEVRARSGITGMGSMTVKYNGSTTRPTEAGTYSVTADIAAGANYTAATGLFLGSYTIL